MKISLLTVAFLLMCDMYIKAQKSFSPTDSFSIVGEIKNPVTYKLHHLDTFPIMIIDDFYYKRQDHILTTEFYSMGGIQIKNILKNVEYSIDDSNTLKKLIFTFIASNDNKVSFTWDEIFHSKPSDSFCIITHKDSYRGSEIKSRIIFIYSKPKKHRRKYLFGLKTIEIKNISS